MGGRPSRALCGLRVEPVCQGGCAVSPAVPREAWGPGRVRLGLASGCPPPVSLGAKATYLGAAARDGLPPRFLLLAGRLRRLNGHGDSVSLRSTPPSGYPISSKDSTSLTSTLKGTVEVCRRRSARRSGLGRWTECCGLVIRIPP